MHNDEPTLVDILDRLHLVKEVGNAIAHCTPPQVFGIHGDWGLGKTSFLYQLQLHITGKCHHKDKEIEDAAKLFNPGVYKKNVIGIWFDAWRYQYEQYPIVALLHEMRAQLSWEKRAYFSAKKTTETAVRGALFSMEEITKKIGFQYSKFVDAKRDWQNENLATSLPSNNLNEHLRDAINKLLPSSEGKDQLAPRLAVFIDDIDRCEPEVAHRLLEGLKVYLTLDNCVFILGMNQKVIVDALAERLKYTMPSVANEPVSDKSFLMQTRASAYMEKLCQNVWQLPAIRNPVEVLEELLIYTISDKIKRSFIIKALKDCDCLPPNPRRLKGYANVVGRLASRLVEENNEQSEIEAVHEAELLLIVAYIYQFHMDLYIRWEKDTNFIKKIEDCCHGRETNIPALNSLIMPRIVETKLSDAIPSSTDVSSFPDPTETNVFWIQPLILKLGTEIAPSRYERFLYRGDK